jgi:hypothetical protein
VLDVRCGRLVWLHGTNLEHLYRFRYNLMSRRLTLLIPQLLLRGVCAVWELSGVAVVAACAGFEGTPHVVAAALLQRGGEWAPPAALVAAGGCCVWALPICHQVRRLQMMQSQSLGQHDRGVCALRSELLLQPVRFQQQSADRRLK